MYFFVFLVRRDERRKAMELLTRILYLLCEVYESLMSQER